MASPPIVDPERFDPDSPIADLDTIRTLNPQRYEMEQLTSIVYENTDDMTCVAVKDTDPDEFWCRGHFPGMPLMPGVIMLESCAQLASYFSRKHDLLGAEIVGFGGVDEVRFRGMVTPGDRLILMVRLLKARRGRMLVAEFQGFASDQLVVEGILRGVPIPVDAVKAELAKRGLDLAI